MATRKTPKRKAVRGPQDEDFLRKTAYLDNAGDGIYVLESNSGRILYANRLALQMLGYNRDELLNLSTRDIEVAHSSTAIRAFHRRARVGAVTVEGLHRRKDGSTFPVEIRLTSLMPEQPHLLLAIVRDITRRKRIYEKLRESEERYQLALSGTRDAIWDWNLDTNQVFFSDRFSQLLGFQTGELTQSFESWESRLHPGDRTKVLAQLEKHLQDGTPFDLEYRMRTKTGEYRWFHDRGKAVRDTSGKPSRMAGAMSDITDRKQIEEEREQSGRRKDEFLALLGHELRNPLAAISFATDLLSSNVTEERRASLEETISRQVNLLRRLVDDLLDLARITSGQISLQMERIELAEFLHRVAGSAQSLFTERGQQFLVRSPSELFFMADGIRLEQIAMNLLHNASKYTGRGGRIAFSGAKENSEIVIRCKDNGYGIPLESQAKIFEPFTRGQVANSYGEASLGIGLTLVKRLTELHGGTIAVHSRGPGKGSEFVVRLPLVAAPPMLPARRMKVSIPRTRRSISIVIVEDNPDVAQTMKIGLEQAGHKVACFPDGPSALAGLSSLKPDAALIDICLPGMDGHELAAKLRKKPNLRQTFFIAVSGLRRPAGNRQPGGNFECYMVKPVNLGELLTLINNRCLPRASRPALLTTKPRRHSPSRKLGQRLRGD